MNVHQHWLQLHTGNILTAWNMIYFQNNNLPYGVTEGRNKPFCIHLCVNPPLSQQWQTWPVYPGEKADCIQRMVHWPTLKRTDTTQGICRCMACTTNQMHQLKQHGSRHCGFWYQTIVWPVQRTRRLLAVQGWSTKHSFCWFLQVTSFNKPAKLLCMPPVSLWDFICKLFTQGISQQVILCYWFPFLPSSWLVSWTDQPGIHLVLQSPPDGARIGCWQPPDTSPSRHSAPETRHVDTAVQWWPMTFLSWPELCGQQ